MITQAITRNTVILSLFAVITAGLLAGTNAATQERIAEERKKALLASLHDIVPPATHDNELVTDTVEVQHPLLGLKEKRTAYLAYQNSQPAAVILPARAPLGYGGPIDLLIGINYDGTVAGVRVVPPHNETPGLGDKIETQKSDWILSFNGKSLQQPPAEQWAVKKDGGSFDQFTGATITPRAVVKAVHRALQYYEQHQQQLFQQREPTP